jgi:hypothetical protein
MRLSCLDIGVLVKLRNIYYTFGMKNVTAATKEALGCVGCIDSWTHRGIAKTKTAKPLPLLSFPSVVIGNLPLSSYESVNNICPIKTFEYDNAARLKCSASCSATSRATKAAWKFGKDQQQKLVTAPTDNIYISLFQMF